MSWPLSLDYGLSFLLISFTWLSFEMLTSMFSYSSGYDTFELLLKMLRGYCSIEFLPASWRLRLFISSEVLCSSSNFTFLWVFDIQANSEPGGIRLWACLLRQPTFLRLLFYFFVAWSSPYWAGASIWSRRSSSSTSMLSIYCMSRRPSSFSSS